MININKINKNNQRAVKGNYYDRIKRITSVKR